MRATSAAYSSGATGGQRSARNSVFSIGPPASSRKPAIVCAKTARILGLGSTAMRRRTARAIARLNRPPPAPTSSQVSPGRAKSSSALSVASSRRAGSARKAGATGA